MRVEIDSVDFRVDLTRVYCRLIGPPNTGQRIDAASLIAGDGTTSYPATDIEGVDFKRYFQWEEDGSIIAEVDFGMVDPALRSCVGMTFITVYGPVVVPTVGLDNGKPCRR